ncbi:MAG TPA: AMP-binding protein [Acidimicrobiia bacterium]
MVLSYGSGVSTVPLIGQTIGDNLAGTVARHPDNEAIVVAHQGVRLRYHEFAVAVGDVARGLLGLGLEKGDRLGIWAPNCLEWALVQYATARLGVILVNINPAYRSHEVGYVLAQSGCRALVSATELKTSSYVDMVDEVRPTLPALEHVTFIGTDDWAQLLERGSGVTEDHVAAVERTLTFDDPINIQYTSGTTGFPKGATLSHHNILTNGFFVGEGCGYTDQDRVCIPVPLYHCFGMVMGNLACTSHGATMVYPAPTFDPAATLRAVQDERCTSLYGVPTMFIAELGLDDFADFDLGSLRTGIMAGSPCPVEVMKRAINDMHMGEVTICYGMTETSPVSTQTGPDDTIDHRVGSVGRVHPHVEVKVVDPETGLTVDRGRSGEFCTRGYSVMLGYWGEPDKTAEAIDTAGWMHTGDLATMDTDGYLNIVGRIKDMIIRGGENIYPREIEEFLYGHPDILDVQVIGVPDERYGEEVMAWVRLRPGAAELTSEAVRAYCDGKIAHYKIPRYVASTEAFPMTVTGKIQKYLLRQQAVDRLGLHDAESTETA